MPTEGAERHARLLDKSCLSRSKSCKPLPSEAYCTLHIVLQHFEFLPCHLVRPVSPLPMMFRLKHPCLAAYLSYDMLTRTTTCLLTQNWPVGLVGERLLLQLPLCGRTHSSLSGLHLKDPQLLICWWFRNDSPPASTLRHLTGPTRKIPLKLFPPCIMVGGEIMKL